MIDILLQQSINDGDIIFKNGAIAYDTRFKTAVYLSLFGGNNDDNNSQNTAKQFWGNFLTREKTRGYRSATQYLLHANPLTSALLPRIEDAVKQDLNWMLEDSLAQSIEVTASIVGIDTVKIIINIDGIILNFEYKYGDTNN